MNRVKKLLYAVGSLVLTVVVGLLGFAYFEDLSWVDSFYMTIITMSTVGYETLNGGLSSEGKIFASFLIIFTIGIFAYTITTITTFVIEGEVQKIFKQYRVNKEVTNMKDHYVICGLGRNGREAAQELMAQSKPFLIIERDDEVIEAFLETYPKAIVLKGDAIEETTLKRANVMVAVGVITALPEDADNVFVTLSVREINKNVSIVARASNEYAVSKLHTAGATKVVVPNRMGGQKMANILTKPGLVDFVDMISGQGEFDLHLEQVPCGDHKALVGKTLAELQIRSHTGCLVLGFRDAKGRVELNPNAHQQIKNGDEMFILGRPKQLADFREKFMK